tara:strand:+ start:2930 stop:4051 length:1122 start_codon:yes stop_codon:yes gene_type:complete
MEKNIMKIDFLNLKRQKHLLSFDINKNINKVLNHQKFILGPENILLENKLKKITKSKFCLTVSSGTDALIIALKGLGIKSNDEVITTPFTYISTVESICKVGAKPVFVDINDKDCLIDADLIESKINKKTKAIMFVSLFGRIPDFKKINKLAKKYNLITIEDAAQSFGAFYKSKLSCNLATISCTSFFPSKPLGCYGDGGAIFTNNKKLFKKCNVLRRHGQNKKKYHYEVLGFNARLDTIQASVLLAKLKLHSKEIIQKRKIRNIYNNNIKNISEVKLLKNNRDIISAEGSYCILAKNRDKLRSYLLKKGIPSMVYYPKPLNEQNIFSKFSKNCKTPIASKVSKKILALPFSAYIKKEEINYICKEIKKFYIS